MKPEERTRIGIILLVISTLMIVGLTLSLHWPWLQAENDRLEPFWRVMIWFADFVSLLWTIWFGISYGFLGRTLPNTVSGDFERRFLLISLLVSLGVDGCITGFTAYEESGAKGRGVETAGQIVGGRPTRNGEKAYLVCSFEDKDGRRYESHLQVRLSDQPESVRVKIQQGRFPFDAKILYDPKWPNRCWVEGFDNEESNRLHWMSAVFLLFQGFSIPIALKYGRWQTATGWIPVYKVIPLWTELVPFSVAALAKFLEGEF